LHFLKYSAVLNFHNLSLAMQLTLNMNKAQSMPKN